MKEKSKHNPFVGILGADEEILWITHQPTITILGHFFQTLSQVLRILGRLLWHARYVLVFLAIYGYPIIVFIRFAFQLTNVEIVNYSLMGVGSLFVVYPIGYLLFGMRKREKRHTFYALTNQRVLIYRPATGITSESLAHVHDIYPMDARTLVFDASGPNSQVWTHIREARKLAALMEHARETYLDDVYLYRGVKAKGDS